MFEYLMPTLVLDEPYGSVLHSAAHAAVLEHIAFAREHHVPWGISESAYAGSDHTLAYQYAPQGVPRLALRRTPNDELVVAPYATALAAQVSPHRAATNLRRLEQARARGRYGFIEALDYSPGRQSGAEGVARVSTFMSHHQGMSIVSIANVLLDGVARHWGMGDARIEAVASLLHERAPREVPPLREPPTSLISSLQLKRSPGMFREVPPGMTAIEPTHLMSNGRYAVAAARQRRRREPTRQPRDHALARRRAARRARLVLPRPLGPPAATGLADPASRARPGRALPLQPARRPRRLQRAWSELEATTTVWVSPEDDIEFRQVVLHNCGERTLDLELLSSFEVTLADPRADESHPAFSNLFVSAEWQAHHQAIVFARKPRLVTDKGLVAANFLAEAEPANVAVRIQVDRQRWLGRNRDASHPLAAFDELTGRPRGQRRRDARHRPRSGRAFAVRMQIAPNAKVRLTFCTAAADDAATLRAVIDKYRQVGNIAARFADVGDADRHPPARDAHQRRELRGDPDPLDRALALARRAPICAPPEASDVCDRRLLWRFGISGDLPIVLVSAGVGAGPRPAALAGAGASPLVVGRRRLRPGRRQPRAGVLPDAAQSRHHLAQGSARGGDRAQPGSADTGFHLLQSSDLHADETATLRALARVRFNADGRPLAAPRAGARRAARAVVPGAAGHVGVALGSDTGMVAGAAGRPIGDFAPAGGEFRFDVSALSRPARPWVNVLANPASARRSARPAAATAGR